MSESSEDLRIFIPISKVDSEKRLVYGIATAEHRDSSGEICDYASTKPHYEKWSSEISKTTGGKSLGNIRSMHGKVAAGKAVGLDFDDENKTIRICAKIVDDNEWAKVVEGVYTGFSQGGRYVRRWNDPEDSTLKRYTADPAEVSLVDTPCLPTARFEYVKSDGAVEMRKFLSVDLEETDGELVKASSFLTDVILLMNPEADESVVIDDVCKVLTKFSEGDHPRDDSGKFTSGGGSVASTAARAARVAIGTGSGALYGGVIGLKGAAPSLIAAAVAGAVPGGQAAAAAAIANAAREIGVSAAIGATAGAVAGARAKSNKDAYVHGAEYGGAASGAASLLHGAAGAAAGYATSAASATAKATRAWRNASKGFAGKYTPSAADAASAARYASSTSKATVRRLERVAEYCSSSEDPLLKSVLVDLEKISGINSEEPSMKKVTNAEVAAHAGVLAKAAGDETKWAEYITPARVELERDDSAPLEKTETVVAATDATVDEVEQVWLAKDGTPHKKKADALAKNAQLTEVVTLSPLEAALAKAEAAISLGKTATVTTDPTKTELIEKFRKYIGEEVYDSRCAMEALGTVFQLMRSEMSEDEGDPAQVAALQAAADRLKDFIVSEIQEDNSPDDDEDPTLAMAAKMGDLAKLGKMSESDKKKRMQDIHDHSCAMGAECDDDDDTEKSVVTGDLAKLQSERDGLAKMMIDVVPRIESLQKALESQAKIIEVLKAQPMQPPSFRTVEKGGDYVFGTESQIDKTITEQFGKLSPEDKATLMVKLSQQDPRRLSVGS